LFLPSLSFFSRIYTSAGRPNSLKNIDGFKEQTAALLDAPTVPTLCCAAHVDTIVEELVDEVSMRSVQLDAIKARGASVRRRASVVVQQSPRNLIVAQRTRH
jgi:hypothetical protein